jgi:hypothetical protein
MLDIERKIMKTQSELPEQGVLLNRKLENFVNTVWTKLKFFWKSVSASTGIQFYVEVDDRDC